MRRPLKSTLLVLNALNYLSTELYVRTTLRNHSTYAKGVTRDIALDIRVCRLKLRHTDPYNEERHLPTHNMFTLENARLFLAALFEE